MLALRDLSKDGLTIRQNLGIASPQSIVQSSNDSQQFSLLRTNLGVTASQPTTQSSSDFQQFSLLRTNLGINTIQPVSQVSNDFQQFSLLRTNLGITTPTTNQIITVQDTYPINFNAFKVRTNLRDGGSAIAPPSDPSGLVFSSTEILTFNGTSTTFTLTPASLLNAPTSNTFTFLITLTTTETTSRDQDPFSSNDTIEKPRFTLAVGSPFTFYYTNGGLWYGQSVGLNVVTNTEYKIMIRITGLNTGSFHVNKASQTTGILSGGASSAINFQKQYILGRYQSSPANFFKGTISYFKLFNRAITNTEATSLGFL